mgnify:CR=1 FL=1
MSRWTVQVFYEARNDDGKAFRATSCVHVEAGDIPSAYAEADKIDVPGKKLGAILPGHHVRFP